MSLASVADHALELSMLIAACAPAIHPATAMALIRHESGATPYAIGINASPRALGTIPSRARLSSQPKTKSQAMALASTLISAGYSVDVGYAQINSRNLKSLGLTLSAAFEPCSNLQAMQVLLQDAYRNATRQYGPGQQALRAALSRYNTGNPTDGLQNGYVQSLYRLASSR